MLTKAFSFFETVAAGVDPDMAATFVRNEGGLLNINALGVRVRHGIRDFFGLRATVRNGFHDGTVKAIYDLDFTIGSDASDDICLFADPLEAGHIRVSRTHLLSSKVRLAAEGGNASVSGAIDLDKFTWVERPLPTTVHIMGVDVEIERMAGLPWFLRPITVAILLVGVAWLAFELYTNVQGFMQPQSPEMVITSPTADGAERRNLPLVEEKLAKTGLAHRIDVTADSDGVLIASGTINPDETVAWRAILQWYDSLASNAVLIDNVVQTDPNNPLPTLASVWFLGERAEVQLSDGRVVTAGDTLQEGWIITKVDREGVNISRDGRDVILRFMGPSNG